MREGNIAYQVERPFFDDLSNRKTLVEACKYLLTSLRDSEGDAVMREDGASDNNS